MDEMNLVFIDVPEDRLHLLPLSYTRPVVDIRNGILTLREKWEILSGLSSSTYTEDYLAAKFPLKLEAHSLLIRSNLCPSPELWKEISELAAGEALYAGETWIAEKIQAGDWSHFIAKTSTPAKKTVKGNSRLLTRPWEIFRDCGDILSEDFSLLTANRSSLPIPATNTVIGDPSLVFIAPGAVVEGAFLNTKSGPIYIGEAAEIMEGTVVRGPFALGAHSQLKAGAKIYGPTIFGPHVKVGGEVNNSVIFGYSNKAHDGFLGNAVIGEWCNLGADTNNSNLKNNYAPVKLWSYAKGGFTDTGMQFCGLIMGDHSKCGINTMFNTGTVIGVSANIFGDGFPRNFIPSFSWGGAAGFKEYRLKDAFETAERVFRRRNMDFNEIEKNIFQAIYAQTPEWHSRE